MGKGASKLRTLIRPIKNFNVEDRAFKAISKEKVKPAPPYPHMEKLMEQIRNDPELMNKGKLSEEEMKNLSQVYLKSQGHNPIIRTKHKLPESRTVPEDNVYGVEEPVVVPKGCLTLRQTLALMEKYQHDSEKYTPEVLAKEFNLELRVTQNILDKFKPFQIYMPPRPDENEGTVDKVKKALAKPFVFDKPKISSR